MWRELIQTLDPAAEFAPGATQEQLAALDRALGIELPQDLKELMAETDGAFCDYGQHLIWSTEEMRQRNTAMWTDTSYRSTFMPLNALLFFSDAGVDGICFAFPIIEGAVLPYHIYAWYPIEDSRPCVTTTLKSYLEQWLSGKLKI